MGSTDLITYLNYVSTWETQSDDDLNTLIDEQKLFLQLGDFQSDAAVDKEFDELVSLATTVRDLTIAEDVTRMAADAAAVASIWSFGFGMAAFVALEVTDQIEKAVISSKSADLNKKLETADTDISAKISDNVKKYIADYKKNNNLINSKAPKGLDTRTCRALLMQFMAAVQRKTDLTPANMKKYAESARILYNSEEINKVYDALDELNLSDKTDADIKKFMNTLVGLKLPPQAVWAVSMVQNVSIAIMANRLGIARAKIKEMAKEANIEPEEVDTNAFKEMDAVGKFATGVAVVMSVVDVILDIIDIVDVVKQTAKMVDELNNTIRPNYKQYFNSIKEASKDYNAAIQPANPDSNSNTGSDDALVGSYECHKYDSGGKNDWHYVTVTKVDDKTYKWTNRANVSWTLTRTSDPNTLAVGQECPYYNFNDGTQQTQYTTAAIEKDGDKVTGIMGPWNELYSKS